MSLLVPAFLIGLVAIAIPVLVHLIRKERDDAVEFPSLMFLSRIPQPTVKRRRIRNPWLLALRALALALLVSAFARPYFESPPERLAGTGAAREIVILLDRSYSMGYGDRWQRALDAAASAVGTLDTDDRATLVVFDATAAVAVPATNERGQITAALDTLQPGSSVTRYTPALKLAQNLLAATPRSQREAVLISDYQRAGWEGGAGAQLPPGAALTPVNVGDDVAENTWITHVTLTRSRLSGLERVTPAVHVRNGGTRAVTLPVVLEAGGRTLQQTSATVEPGASAVVQFEPVSLGSEPLRLVVRAGEDALPEDNRFHLIARADAGLRAFIVQPPGGAHPYLRSALSLANEPAVDVREGQTVPSAAELERLDVLVLDDVLPPDGDAGRRLTEWVRDGGGLVIALGERSANARWGEAASELAGSAPSRVNDRLDSGGARFGTLDYSNPVFELFGAARGTAFGSARFLRYRPLPEPPADSLNPAAVIARFDDGSPALIERTVGRGRVLVWGSTLGTAWNNLALQPAYLPLVHRIVQRASGRQAAPEWSTAGQVVDVGGAGAASLLVNSPAGERRRIEGTSLVTLAEPGFHEVRAVGSDAGVTAHAVNLDVTESELAAVHPDEVMHAVTVSGDVQPGSGSVQPSPEERERAQRLWWYLMLVVLALLAAETVLANRRSVRAA